MSLDGQQIHALVYLAKSTRPRGAAKWDEAGIAANVKKLTDAGLSAQEVIDRTLRHAWDVNAKTPGVLCAPAPSGSLDACRSNAVVYPVRAGSVEECPVHPGQRAVSCSYCAADAIASEGPSLVRRRPESALVKEAREARSAELRAAIAASQEVFSE